MWRQDKTFEDLPRNFSLHLQQTFIDWANSSFAAGSVVSASIFARSELKGIVNLQIVQNFFKTYSFTTFVVLHHVASFPSLCRCCRFPYGGALKQRFALKIRKTRTWRRARFYILAGVPMSHLNALAVAKFSHLLESCYDSLAIFRKWISNLSRIDDDSPSHDDGLAINLAI